MRYVNRMPVHERSVFFLETNLARLTLPVFYGFLEMRVITYAQLLSQSMAFVLVVDRLLATFCPHKYKIWTYGNSTIPLIVLANAFAFAQTAVHFSDSWMSNGERILVSCAIENT